MDRECGAKNGCLRCKNVVLLSTFKKSAKKLPGSKEIKDKLAKIRQLMKKLCETGVLHSPEQLNDEITVSYGEVKITSIAIKAIPLRVYGWVYQGTFYASFVIVKRTQKLDKLDKERIERNLKQFIKENVL